MPGKKKPIRKRPVRPEYYPLLMLASGQKREEFLETILRRGETYYLDYALMMNREEVYTMAEKIGVLPMRTLEESVRDLIAHGDLDPAVLTRHLVRECGVEEVASGLRPAQKEALARKLLVDLGIAEETVQHLLDERPKRRPQSKRSG
jgi:hypothetical protein